MSPPLRRIAALLSLALVAACEQDGTDPVARPARVAVSITTQSLAPGNVGYAYFLELEAAGGQEPYTWWVSSAGDPLPGGLGLTPEGQIAGIPTEAGARSVVIVVQDADSELDVVALPLETRDVEIRPSVSGTVRPRDAVIFTANGGVAQYDFSLSQNRSGGTVTPSGVYIAGDGTGVDVVRCTDRDGFFEEAAVTVGDDPFAGFEGRWGTTDVWWIDWDVVYDPAPDYASDLDDVLVTLGLRRPESTGREGTEADRLARLLVIRRTLAHLSTYYGNGPDGQPRPGGLAVSFAGPGRPGGTTPAVGETMDAAPHRYSTICVRYGPGGSVAGTAWYDADNARVEHDCGDPNGTGLGVFANRILPGYVAAFANSLVPDPVGPADVPALEALLAGAAPGGARAAAIHDVADGFGRVVAAVLAHEVGHSLGLEHSSPGEGPGDLMNTKLAIAPPIAYAFNPAHWAQLQQSLPGPNR